MSGSLRHRCLPRDPFDLRHSFSIVEDFFWGDVSHHLGTTLRFCPFCGTAVTQQTWLSRMMVEKNDLLVELAEENDGEEGLGRQCGRP